MLKLDQIFVLPSYLVFLDFKIGNKVLLETRMTYFAACTALISVFAFTVANYAMGSVIV